MRIRALAGVVAVVAVLTSCGQEVPSASNAFPPREAPSSAPPVPRPSADTSVGLDSSPTIEEIKQHRQFHVGVRNDAPAFAARVGPGEYAGFDVEIAGLLATRLGLDPDTEVTYRMLPPSLLYDALASGSVDAVIGWQAGGRADLADVGPYAVTDEPRFVVVRGGDDAMVEEFEGILDAAVADGSWQRAYDATLGREGIPARPR
ncbi:transporter substrate-binding domain-containing protein [Saccharopolyspora sp. CA-218241]|uniref:transporter substrate-binding domain-containing protein n=1 Tax=Saccharopolyspora sp. CA-218241 TaxID=3240027 RepID=UPI003D9747D2